MPAEAAITINGVALTPAQAMTIRVALQSFASDLTQDGLGDDEHGRRMTRLYLDSVNAINELMMPPTYGEWHFLNGRLICLDHKVEGT